MDIALGWIGDVARWLLALIPRLLIVEATHAGVAFVWGKKIKPLPPGLHFYWPVTTKVLIAPIKRQTANLDTQYLVTDDGRPVGVAGILVYEVSDIVKLLTECWDYEETIRDMAMAAIKDVVVSHALDELLEQSSELEEELEETLRPELEHFGINVIRLTLSDLAPAKVLAHWGWNGQ